jgi:hypothetical protein
MLAGLAELGWNKALDIAQNPQIAERERADLAWWVSQVRMALDTTGTTTPPRSHPAAPEPQAQDHGARERRERQ